MEFKHYSVDVVIENKEVEVLGVKLMYKLEDGMPEFINGELVAPKFAVVNKKQLTEIIEFETKTKKSLTFINGLTKKIEEALNSII